MITSVNLSPLPFQGSNDSTRAQMASKQISQALVHENCEIPYVISKDYRYLSEFSTLGMYIAKDDGKVLINENEIIIIYYNNLDEIVTRHVPKHHRTHGIFCSSLRFSLPAGSTFKKGDIIYNYNDFREGLPSFGYNLMTGYFNFFGYNHEDGIVISEFAAENIKHELVETVYVPIYDYSIFMPLYENNENSLHFFPNLGQKIDSEVLCTFINPKIMNDTVSTNDLKQKMLSFVSNSSVSDLINMLNTHKHKFSVEKVTSKVANGKVNGVKIHKIAENPDLVDKRLEKVINNIRQSYYKVVRDTVQKISSEINEGIAYKTAYEHFIYDYDDSISKMKSFKNASYILEFNIVKEDSTVIGDKLCNRFAGKGIISLVLPEELRPIAQTSNKPIDLIFNPFGVFSRMNLSQIIDCVVSKNVQFTESNIDGDPLNTPKYLKELNENIIKHFGDDKYYNDVNTLISNIEKDDNIREEFINHMKRNNLYVEAPSFSELNTREILNNSVPIKEDVKIPKECLAYLRDKMGANINYPLEDVTVKNTFCGPTYILKLYKLVSELINARDLGPVKAITKQPLKGRSVGGGSKLGQMEVEGLIAHGTIKSLKELISVKCDLTQYKQDLIKQLINSGKYNLPKNVNDDNGGSIKIVKTIINFLQK